MPYALPSHGARSHRAPGHTAGRRLPGCHGRLGRAYAGNRPAADDGAGDCQRPRPGVARDGAAEHGGVGRPHSLSAWLLRRVAESGAGEDRRPGGGLGSEPVPVDGAGEGIFIFIGWAAGYAHGSNHGHDSGRPGQSHCRKGTRRSDLSARRRKEGAEDSQSNRSGTAHTEHTAPGRCSGTGRAPDGPPASRHEDLHGAAAGCQQRAGGTGPVAGNRPRAARTRRPHGGHHLHVARGPQGQAGISRTGSAGAGRNPDEASPGAVRGRDSENPASRSAKLRALEMV